MANERNRCRISLCLLPFLLAVGIRYLPILAADEKVVLKAGDSCPGWTDLPGTDGQVHSLTDLSSEAVVIVCFTCNTCPYAIDYEDRLIALQEKYRESGDAVTVVAINSNAVAADSLEKMQARAKEKHFNFAYLRDDSQQVVKAWGALYTPEFFVLNKDRRIVYTGALDDSTKAADVRIRYVELAVEAALKDSLPEVTKTAARGCLVRFRRQRG